jgi:hypothetical protein
MFECSKERMKDEITNSAQFGATGNGDKVFYGTIESRSCKR